MYLGKIQLLAFLESQELREGRASQVCNKEGQRKKYILAAEQSSSHKSRGAIATEWDILDPALSPLSL